MTNLALNQSTFDQLESLNFKLDTLYVNNQIICIVSPIVVKVVVHVHITTQLISMSHFIHIITKCDPKIHKVLNPPQ